MTTNDRDLVAEIDMLIDEQLDAGEPVGGYDHGDPGYPKCPHCARDFHGLAITERIENMRRWGQFDEDYRYDEDDSRVLCPGSTFIGPMPAATVPAQLSMEARIRRYADVIAGMIGMPIAGDFRRRDLGVIDDGSALDATTVGFDPAAGGMLSHSEFRNLVDSGRARWWRCEDPRQDCEWEFNTETGFVDWAHRIRRTTCEFAVTEPNFGRRYSTSLQQDSHSGRFYRTEVSYRNDDCNLISVEVFAPEPPPEWTGTWRPRDEQRFFHHTSARHIDDGEPMAARMVSDPAIPRGSALVGRFTDDTEADQ